MLHIVFSVFFSVRSWTRPGFERQETERSSSEVLLIREELSDQEEVRKERPEHRERAHGFG